MKKGNKIQNLVKLRRAPVAPPTKTFVDQRKKALKMCCRTSKSRAILTGI